jgi:hypothetical protein
MKQVLFNLYIGLESELQQSSVSNPERFLGEFRVLKDGRLVKGADSNVETYSSEINLNTRLGNMIHFHVGANSFHLSIKGKQIYLREYE